MLIYCVYVNSGATEGSVGVGEEEEEEEEEEVTLEVLVGCSYGMFLKLKP